MNRTAAMRSLGAAAALLALCSVGTHADEQPVSLVNAPGHEAVENNCAACHSLDYPRTNAPFLDRKGWQAEVDKMIKVFGADIAPPDATAIVDYLTKNYGAGG
jgi:mono/diheme cytochrome c family protein